VDRKIGARPEELVVNGEKRAVHREKTLHTFNEKGGGIDR